MQRRRSVRRFAASTILVFTTALAAGCSPAGDGLMASGGDFEAADPASLIGLAPQQIGETLGLPELQRIEPPAEVWQYRTQSCVFDLYIYDEEGDRRAVHYTARSRDNGEVDAGQCLGSIVERYRVAAAEEAAEEDPAQL